ncbi:hypothetical protein CAF53_02370 [Sphingobium sp. LB126]|uniref:MurR/RpiR family transcriptional regulator n=1 Tax=Sphingobium sp. LB126 TaxID=1983755 RepID=UPI000C20D7AA|nr:MurR/RpiR family transcriptional regulator [Sphingobium sp. LB126]PJG47212.1 hypothetical protein CAF53_02370 [Sphingobium sp. LB126]
MDGETQGSGALATEGTLPPTDDIRDALRGIREGAGEGTVRIIDMILNRPLDVLGMTLIEMAEAASVSDSMVIKVLKRVNLTGFQSLKIALAHSLGSPTNAIHEDLSRGDDYGTIIRKTFGANVQALLDTELTLKPELLGQAVEILSKAEKIDIYGIGSAAPIAEDAYYRLIRIGLDARISTDSHLQVTTASIANKKTAVLTISHSGSTLETLDATKLAKKAGAKVVVITGYKQSPIQQHADVVLQTRARETKFRTEAMTSRIAQLAIVDALIAALALRHYDSSLATLNTTFEALSLRRV